MTAWLTNPRHILLIAVGASAIGTTSMLGVWQSASMWVLLEALLGAVCVGIIVAALCSFREVEE
jgi:hypothetical protein